ncbi:Glyoxalase/bleomycin resistance protein/dioxygenase [Thermaerobacter marianensis DSM 12885]|uniref:Glyoxalase/bleomycin resistance protein/dioxygenase n=2 Tax=Thermaerobacter marianensis TaxID=73919 RepID=E6SMS0_THEM7|nr:ArsI/CadI family heavy metal resistance metalloenzyme [Thermaerobacter marianensis]ADU51562.1 Glyoxalase/bleomycin resistance protein/dioxygenase [Thermaerobacter marianensis DSM 12885]
MRVHIALPVSDLPASVRFYERFFGKPPARMLPGYAQFLLDNPGLNLALTQAGPAKEPGSAAGSATSTHHFGIEVESVTEVRSALERVRDGGLAATVEEDTLCCYSRQDKFWVVDPDGHRWEVFFVSRRHGSPGKTGHEATHRNGGGGPIHGPNQGPAPGEEANEPGCCEPAGAPACCAECCAG